MNSDKKVSIVLPVYNGEKYLSLSIESILSQSYSNWELIIVNDCSTDSTEEIVDEYAQKDNRIKVINNKQNLKLPASLNAGFLNATGEYYTWTSDDNLYKPDAISYMVNYLNKNHHIGLVSCMFDVIDENGKIIGSSKDYYRARKTKELLFNNNIGACFMYRSDIAKTIGDYDTQFFLAEDYDYWLRIAAISDIAYLNDNLYLYRMHKDNLSSKHKTKINNIAKEVCRKNAYLVSKYISKNIINFLILLTQVFYRYELQSVIEQIFSITNMKENGIKTKILTIFGIKIKLSKEEINAKN